MAQINKQNEKCNESIVNKNFVCNNILFGERNIIHRQTWSSSRSFPLNILVYSFFKYIWTRFDNVLKMHSPSNISSSIIFLVILHRSRHYETNCSTPFWKENILCFVICHISKTHLHIIYTQNICQARNCFHFTTHFLSEPNFSSPNVSKRRKFSCSYVVNVSTVFTVLPKSNAESPFKCD